jgi:hypothetical protein
MFRSIPLINNGSLRASGSPSRNYLVPRSDTSLYISKVRGTMLEKESAAFKKSTTLRK